MKAFRRILSVCLVLALAAVSCSLSAIASQSDSVAIAELTNQSNIENNEKVNNILTQLGEIRAAKMNTETQFAPQSARMQSEVMYNTIETELEQQLTELGVVQLNDAEIQQLTGSDVSPQATVPSSTSSVRWYSTQYTHIYNNKKYSVQHVYAQGLSAGSCLAIHQSTRYLYSNQQVVINKMKELGSIYAQKFIGNIEIISWTPYELLFTKSETVTNESQEVGFNSLSTICFTYVKEANNASSQELLCYVSSSLSLDYTITFAGFDNGKPYHEPVSPKTPITITSSVFAPFTDAIIRYNDTSANCCSYVSSITFYNHDKTKSMRRSLPMPSFPGAIY